MVRHLGIAESTWNRWRSQYGGMKADEAKRLRQLETENARLKKRFFAFQRGAGLRSDQLQPPTASRIRSR